jgi:hypothetical protein
MAEMTPLLVLEDSVIRSMAENPNFQKEFPFLTGLVKAGAAPKPGCAPCQQKAQQRVQQLNGIRQSLVSLPDERKRRLKEMLNAKQLRIRLLQGNKIVDYTF